MCLCRFERRAATASRPSHSVGTRGALGRPAGLQRAWRWRGCCDAATQLRRLALSLWQQPCELQLDCGRRAGSRSRRTAARGASGHRFELLMGGGLG